MNGTTCLIGVFVIFIFIIIVASLASSQPNTTTRTHEQTARPSAQPPSRSTGSGFRVTARRPGMTNPSPAITLPAGMDNPIPIPQAVMISHNQKTCKVCHQSILWSSRQTGWARCMSSRKLVHGHCHTFMQRQNAGVRNWCTVCSGQCVSGQAMRTEGRDQ